MILLILQLALVGFLAWLVLTYIPMPDPIKKVIIVVIVIALILYVLRIFGLGSLLSMPRF
jgi:hypothetical protein